eukprot:6226289-Karenia_brevis.AAC.1
MVSAASPSELVMLRNPITSTPITPTTRSYVTMPYPMTDVRLPPSARGVFRPASRDPMPSPPRQ